MRMSCRHAYVLLFADYGGGGGISREIAPRPLIYFQLPANSILRAPIANTTGISLLIILSRKEKLLCGHFFFKPDQPDATEDPAHRFQRTGKIYAVDMRKLRLFTRLPLRTDRESLMVRTCHSQHVGQPVCE